MSEDRTYPLAWTGDGDDPRFTIGLLYDVEKVLKDHGYPPLTGMDHLELQHALYRFLYARVSGEAS
jgi:hypothetical protein